MLIVFFRAIILYVVIVFCIRFMGKKQLGELQPSELVVTIMLSNIATLPIEDADIPLSIGLIPILTFACLDIFSSYITLRSRRFRKIVCGSPKVIISNGKVHNNTMKELRLTVDDLMEAMRTQQVFDISDVQFAVVETTGQISVYTKKNYQPVTPNDLAIKCEEYNPPILIISDGEVLETSLKSLGVDKRWLDKTLAGEKKKLKDVFIMTCDPKLQYTIIEKEN